MHFQTYAMLFVLFTSIYYVSFISFLAYIKYDFSDSITLSSLFLIFSSGFVSFLLSIKISNLSKSVILKSLKSLMYSKFVYEFYVIVKIFTRNISIDVDIFIIVVCVFNFIRSLFKNLFLNCFNYEQKLSYFKDTLDMEKYLYNLFTGKELSKDNILNVIKNGPKYDSKTLFCILCDNQILNKYSARFWELNMYSQESISIESQQVDEKSQFFRKESYRFPTRDLNHTPSNSEIENTEDLSKPTVTKELTRNEINSVDNAKKQNLDSQADRRLNKNNQMEQQTSSSANFSMLEHNIKAYKIFMNRNNSNQSLSPDTIVDGIQESDQNRDLQKPLNCLEMNGKITRASLSKYFTDPGNVLNIITQGLDTELEYQDFHDSIRQFNVERSAYVTFIEENAIICSLITKIHWFFHILIVLAFAVQLFATDGILKFVLYPFIILMFPIGFNVIDSFFFLIYMHPFDIGDRVFIDDENLIVKSIRPTSTVFERWNNEMVIYTNGYLRSKILKNIRRSKNQTWSLAIKINRKDMNKAEQFETMLKNFCSENKAFEDIIFSSEEVIDNMYVKINLLVKHSINYQNGYYMCYVQTRFMKKLVFFLNYLKIRFDPLEYPIFITGAIY